MVLSVLEGLLEIVGLEVMAECQGWYTFEVLYGEAMRPFQLHT